ncbi:hypothetical protein PAP_03110 [Palaeococcus pacificus DY20341]|uniref:CARDB domain-containing protein n=1 Tax=Palaeococcus pacificus DY20341 TaxID=1343739 RepID=A0A075LSV3_9EURY|nr:hypothetical protein [Palaeococcus pacificus]AIF69042.1 hypothetical protein PAP_03110 [Palaeococcus pacificus DY20341]
MKSKVLSFVLFAVMLASIMLPPASGQPVIMISPEKNTFSANPGDIVDIYFNITNLGNESAKNVFITIEKLPKGATYTQEIIQELSPNQTYEGHVQIILNDVIAGTYNLNLVAKMKDSPIIVKVPLTLRVLTKVDYYLKISSQDKYVYGNDVTITCEVRSKANGILNGIVEIEVYRGSELIKTIAESTYITAYGKKSYEIVLPRPEVGRYLVIMHTKFGGISKTESKSFEVYQRELTYDAKFENGVITVQVKDEEGKGVSNIPVTINGLQFKTDNLGLVQIEARNPGTYRITFNFDGKIVETIVEVKKLFLDYKQQNETLIVYVRDSSGKGIANVSVVAEGAKGRAYGVTDESGKVEIDLNEIGFGVLKLKADSSKYLGDEKTVSVEKPTPTQTSITTTTTTTTTTISYVQNQTVPKPPKDYGNLPIILILSAILFGSTSYLAFFRPIILEEQLDKYYFIKVKAPKLRSLENFVVERNINAADVRATKGKVKIEGTRVIWEIEKLEPEEEAFLQVLL